jgi:hypothetical protein
MLCNLFYSSIVIENITVMNLHTHKQSAKRGGKTIFSLQEGERERFIDLTPHSSFVKGRGDDEGKLSCKSFTMNRH